MAAETPAKWKARITYVLLILISLAIPALHYSLSCEAMRSTRGDLLLTPATFLLVIHFGEFATLVPVLLLALLVLSWKFDRLVRFSTLCGISVAMLVYATVYGVWCCFLLSHVLLERSG